MLLLRPRGLDRELVRLFQFSLIDLQLRQAFEGVATDMRLALVGDPLSQRDPVTAKD